MAQFARPDSNVTQTGFTGGFAEIDEATASDADFANTPDNTTGQLEVGLSNISDPGVGTGHILRYRLAKADTEVPPSTSGNTQLGTVSLYQGGTLVAADAERTLGAWTTFSLTLSGAQADAITDYADLRIRFDSPASGGGPGGNRRGGAISWAELETPDAAAGVTGTGSVAFGIASAGSGSVTGPAFAGSGGVSFGFSLDGSGTFVPGPVSGDGAVSFGFSTSGTGDYTPQPVTGTGGVSFGFSTSGSGGQAASYSGSGGVSFSVTTAGSGTVETPAFTGSGGVSFGAATSGVGAFSGSSAISGSGGVAFGISTAGLGSFVPPVISGSGGVTFGFSTAGSVADNGPWISHGTIHIAHPPYNH